MFGKDGFLLFVICVINAIVAAGLMAYTLYNMLVPILENVKGVL